jgi:tetratricopeptide (TPR) repeat protein
MAYDPNGTTVIFNKNTEAWGAYFYEEKDDALRVNVKPVALKESVERLTFAFGDETDSSAVVSLQWEKMKIPFTVSTELQKLQLASIEKEMNGTKSFYASNHMEAAVYYKDHNVHLDKALEHINTASRTMQSFWVYSQKAELLEMMGKPKEAEEAMQKAIAATTSAYQLHGVARRFLAEKKTAKAMELFKLNYSKYPDTYTTNMGMARGLEAVGDKKQALKYATKALPQAPDANNKQGTEALIKNLKDGKVAKS